MPARTDEARRMQLIVFYQVLLTLQKAGATINGHPIKIGNMLEQRGRELRVARTTVWEIVKDAHPE